MYSGIFSGTNQKANPAQQPTCRATSSLPSGYKSQQVRRYLASHPRASTAEICQAMRAEGLQVSYGMVGQLRREFRNLLKPVSAPRGDFRTTSRPADSCIMCTMEEWVRAQQLLRAFQGDVTRVVTALTMLKLAGYQVEEDKPKA